MHKQPAFILGGSYLFTSQPVSLFISRYCFQLSRCLNPPGLLLKEACDSLVAFNLLLLSFFFLTRRHGRFLYDWPITDTLKLPIRLNILVDIKEIKEHT